MQSFSARMPLLTATSAFGLGSRHWSSQQCYLHCLLDGDTPPPLFAIRLGRSTEVDRPPESVPRSVLAVLCTLKIQSVKVKFSHTRYRALGPELIPVYRQSARR